MLFLSNDFLSERKTQRENTHSHHHDVIRIHPRGNWEELFFAGNGLVLIMKLVFILSLDGYSKASKKLVLLKCCRH